MFRRLSSPASRVGRMRDTAKNKTYRLSKAKEKSDEKQQETVARMIADPEPGKIKLRLSTAEKMQLKSQLKEECFSIYRWYINTLPKEEEEDTEFPPLPPIDYCISSFDDPKIEPINEMLGTDGQVYADWLDMLGKQGEKMDTIKIDLVRENETLKTQMDEMRKEHNERMVNLITRASDSQAMDRARIEEMTLKLARYEKGLPKQHQSLSGREDIVIDDDETTSDHPIVKNAHREAESVPSPEILELHQKLQKLQLDLNIERACREMKTRIMKELEIKLEDASKKLEDGARRELKAFHNNIALVRENKELQDVVAQECRRKDTDSEQAREKEVLNEEVDDLKRTINQVMDINCSLQERVAETAARALAQMKGVELYDTGHPINLFQLCVPAPIDSIPFHSACYELRKSALTIDKLLFNDYCAKTLLEETMANVFAGGAVSTLAFKFWLHTLKKAAAAPAAGERLMQQPMVAAAPTPTHSGHRLLIDELTLNLPQYGVSSIPPLQPLQFNKPHTATKAAKTVFNIREAAAPEGTIPLLDTSLEPHQIGG